MECGIIKTTMNRRPYKPNKLIWFLLALLFAGQSLLPVAALAEISVRCIGAPASAAPCAHGTFALIDTASITKHFSALACCRTMVNCPTMAAGGFSHTSVPVSRGSAMSPPKCLVSINLLNARPTAPSLQVHRWLLLTSPALAPPAARPASIAVSTPSSIQFSTVPFHLPPSVLTHAHGLRAPPSA